TEGWQYHRRTDSDLGCRTSVRLDRCSDSDVWNPMDRQIASADRHWSDDYGDWFRACRFCCFKCRHYSRRYFSSNDCSSCYVFDHCICDNTRERFRKSYRSEEHTSELQSRFELVCRLLLEKRKN